MLNMFRYILFITAFVVMTILKVGEAAPPVITFYDTILPIIRDQTDVDLCLVQLTGGLLTDAKSTIGEHYRSKLAPAHPELDINGLNGEVEKLKRYIDEVIAYDARLSKIKELSPESVVLEAIGETCETQISKTNVKKLVIESAIRQKSVMETLPVGRLWKVMCNTYAQINTAYATVEGAAVYANDLKKLDILSFSQITTSLLELKSPKLSKASVMDLSKEDLKKQMIESEQFKQAFGDKKNKQLESGCVIQKMIKKLKTGGIHQWMVPLLLDTADRYIYYDSCDIKNLPEHQQTNLRTAHSAVIGDLVPSLMTIMENMFKIEPRLEKSDALETSIFETIFDTSCDVKSGPTSDLLKPLDDEIKKETEKTQTLHMAELFRYRCMYKGFLDVTPTDLTKFKTDTVDEIKFYTNVLAILAPSSDSTVFDLVASTMESDCPTVKTHLVHTFNRLHLKCLAKSQKASDYSTFYPDLQTYMYSNVLLQKCVTGVQIPVEAPTSGSICTRTALNMKMRELDFKILQSSLTDARQITAVIDAKTQPTGSTCIIGDYSGLFKDKDYKAKISATLTTFGTPIVIAELKMQCEHLMFTSHYLHNYQTYTPPMNILDSIHQYALIMHRMGTFTDPLKTARKPILEAKLNEDEVIKREFDGEIYKQRRFSCEVDKSLDTLGVSLDATFSSVAEVLTETNFQQPTCSFKTDIVVADLKPKVVKAIPATQGFTDKLHKFLLVSTIAEYNARLSEIKYTEVVQPIMSQIFTETTCEYLPDTSSQIQNVLDSVYQNFGSQLPTIHQKYKTAYMCKLTSSITQALESMREKRTLPNYMNDNMCFFVKSTFFHKMTPNAGTETETEEPVVQYARKFAVVQMLPPLYLYHEHNDFLSEPLKCQFIRISKGLQTHIDEAVKTIPKPEEPTKSTEESETSNTDTEKPKEETEGEQEKNKEVGTSRSQRSYHYKTFNQRSSSIKVPPSDHNSPQSHIIELYQDDKVSSEPSESAAQSPGSVAQSPGSSTDQKATHPLDVPDDIVDEAYFAFGYECFPAEEEGTTTPKPKIYLVRSEASGALPLWALIIVPIIGGLILLIPIVLVILNRKKISYSMHQRDI